ncbi:16915_t:CDS:1, partial [Funneliformis mosseae]
MAEMAEIILALLEIIPEYVLVNLLTIAIMGDSSYSNFRKKIMWFLRCLKCSFDSLFHSFNIE